MAIDNLWQALSEWIRSDFTEEIYGVCQPTVKMSPLLGVNPTEKMSPLWLCSAGDPRIMLRLAAESRIGLRPALLLDSASAPD